MSMRFEPEVEQKMIAALPQGLITVFKQVRRHDGRYRPMFRGGRFRVGVNFADTRKTCYIVKNNSLGQEYQSGFHSYRDVIAMQTTGTYRFCIKYQIFKRNITAIGMEGNNVVYVTDQIISPSLRDESAIVL